MVIFFPTRILFPKQKSVFTIGLTEQRSIKVF